MIGLRHHTLGRYKIPLKLSEGGMSEVYLAQDAKLERKVALKVLCLRCHFKSRTNAAVCAGRMRPI